MRSLSLSHTLLLFLASLLCVHFAVTYCSLNALHWKYLQQSWRGRQSTRVTKASQFHPIVRGIPKKPIGCYNHSNLLLQSLGQIFLFPLSLDQMIASKWMSELFVYFESIDTAFVTLIFPRRSGFLFFITTTTTTESPHVQCIYMHTLCAMKTRLHTYVYTCTHTHAHTHMCNKITRKMWKKAANNSCFDIKALMCPKASQN